MHFVFRLLGRGMGGSNKTELLCHEFPKLYTFFFFNATVDGEWGMEGGVGADMGEKNA